MSNSNHSDWTLRFSDQSIADNADQVEWQAYLLGAAAIDEGTRDELIADALDDFDSGAINLEDWAQAEATREEAVNQTADELRRRTQLMRDAYPYEIHRNSLKYAPNRKNLVYEYCLAVSVAPDITRSPWNALPCHFETLTGLVVSHYLGGRAKWYRTGWPAMNGSRPVKFREMLETLSPQLDGEIVWSPKDSSLPADPTHQHAKDETIDVLLWLPMPDKRRGKVVLAVQCACGGTDWHKKRKELDINQWRRWARPCFHAEPARGFALPRHIRNTALFDETNEYAGTTFDRARLGILGKEIQIPQSLSADLEDLISKIKDHYQ